jgi:hypothetical protein
MNDEQYINSITLEYLLNPYLYEKINSQKNATDNLIFKDILFYRKRICQITKEMCKGQYINETFKAMFLNYAHALVYYLKQLDEKDILQEDYNDLLLTKLSSNSSQLLDISFNIDNILINKPKEISNLDNFVKKINVNMPEKILPKQRIVNIKNPALKNKGLKKKIST